MQESCWDSDEEIGWGPITLKECKARLRLPQKIKHRHTDIYSDKFESKACDMSESPSTDYYNNNSSSASSKYVTPNESFYDDKSEAFLGKLNKILTDPISDSSIYSSALDTTTSNSKETQKKHDTLLNIIGNENFNLDAIQQTLVENTYCFSVSELFNKNESTDDSEVIVIDSDDDDVGDADISSPINSSQIKSEIESPQTSFSNASNTPNSYHTGESSQNSSFDEISGCQPLDSSESDKSVSIQVPEIDIDQFNDSVDFNDTLEEMEQLLKSTKLQQNPLDESTDSQFSEAEIDSESSYNRSQSIISGSFLNKGNDCFKSQIPKACDKYRSPLKTPTLKSPVNSRQIKNITPSKLPTLNTNFKNVVSPVGLYIKNSPKMYLKQNVALKPQVENLTPKKMQIEENKENFRADFPKIWYRPAKNTIETKKEKIIQLPLSIKNMVIEPVVVKHESRICNIEMDESYIEKKLADCNTTNCTTDFSILNEDVSILTSKQAFIQ